MVALLDSVEHLEDAEVDLLVEVDFLEAAAHSLEVQVRYQEVAEVDLLVEVDFLEAAVHSLVALEFHE